MPNRLAGETSPYLLQHSENPVDWYPWGHEALARARDEDRPIFLSIGYSACHWCHVMAHESFENAETARLMNDNFVNIKVDREERPDLDSIYMAATQLMTGQGGWPMSVFLTPDGRPYYAGTYFPPEDTHGRPGFRRVLQAVAEAYRDRKGEILAGTNEVIARIEGQARPRTSAEPLRREIIGQAFRALTGDFDSEHGGFGSAPKFPQPMTYEFLLRYSHATGDPRGREMAELTLTRMARGGMYDQLGGGFHRYSTDPAWLVPHFEKMLYDNGLLAQLYVHAWQATGRQAYRRTAEDILAYLEREMLDPSGGFYSAQDADSEGEEGKYFVWWESEIDQALGSELARIAKLYWGVAQDGNFEGRNILSVPQDDEAVAATLGIAVEALTERIEEARRELLQVRAGRVAPGRDEKVLTGWNALALKGFAEAGAAFGNDHYLDIARSNAGFLLANLEVDGRLLRTWRARGGRREAKLNGYLEDYAYLIDALVTLYEATFERRWLDEAERLASGMVELFWDADLDVFYDTGRDHEALAVRPRDVFDNATPCGGSAAALGLLRLARLTGEASFEQFAVRSMRSVLDIAVRAPSGLGHWLAAIDFYTSRVTEVAIIGQRTDPRVRELLGTVWERFLPNRVVAGSDGTRPEGSPLLKGRTTIGGRPSAYVCEDYVCKLPVTSPADLAAQLDERATARQ